MFSSLRKRLKLIGLSLLLVSLVLNEFTLHQTGIIFKSDRVNAAILLINIYIIALGIYLITANHTVTLARLLKNHLNILFIIVTIDLFLHLSSYILISKDNDILETKEWGDEKAQLKIYQDSEWAKEYFHNCSELPRELYSYVMYKRTEFHSETINIDSSGRRYTWNSRNESPTFKIYILGGSTIWGTGARDGYTIPSFVSRILSDLQYSVEVINLGESRYNMMQEIVSLILMLRSEEIPDLVLFYDGVNDVADLSSLNPRDWGEIGSISQLRGKKEDSDTEIHVRIGKGLLNALSHSKIFQTVELLHKQLIGGLINSGDETAISLSTPRSYRNPPEDVANEIFANYEKNLQLLSSLSDSYGFEYICFWQPVIFTENWLHEEEKGVDAQSQDSIYSCTFKLARERILTLNNSKVVDISDALAYRTEPFYIDFCHISEEGNESVARRIVREITERNLIPTRFKK